MASATDKAEEDIRALEKARDRLKKDLYQIERQIFDLEGSYLEETSTTGNVLAGWDVVLGRERERGKFQKREVPKRPTKEDRLFTLSSVTAPSFTVRKPVVPVAPVAVAPVADAVKSEAVAAPAVGGAVPAPPTGQKRRGRPPNPNKHADKSKKQKV